MNNPSQTVADMWKAYCSNAKHSVSSTEKYDVYHFCDDQENADALAELVKSGRKRATSSLYMFYEKEGEKVPQEGAYSIITNWNGEAQCVIRNTQVTQKPYNQVSAEFAYKEGEGDLSLEYWRRVHHDYFTHELEAIGETFHEDMVLVCEEFEVVYLPKDK